MDLSISELNEVSIVLGRYARAGALLFCDDG